MTDTRPYARLAALTDPLDTENILSEWTWQYLYEYADGDAPEPDQIAAVTHLWATSPEGYGSTDIAFLARLTDGRWATCVAWSDTSGFGCQQQVDWRISATCDRAIAQGLDKEARANLGLPLPGEGGAR